MNLQEILTIFKSKENDTNKQGMKRFGINIEYAFGISVSELRTIAKQLKTNHPLAIEL